MTHFSQLAALLATTPEELRRRTLARAAEIAADMGRFGRWFCDGRAEERFESAARQVVTIFGSTDMQELWDATTCRTWQERAFSHFVYLTGGPIRPSSMQAWSQDKPFPIPDALCSALLQGYAVDLSGIDFFDDLFPRTWDEPGLARGKWFLWQGYIHPRR